MEDKQATFRFNKGLADRFVSDFNIPIGMTGRTYFQYYLQLYEADYGALTKWERLWAMIDERFGGDAEKFLAEYYDIRENIIQSILANEAFQKFNTGDMSRFAIKDAPKVSKNNVFNANYHGKTLLSVDLRKANFQALRWADPEIVFGTKTYEDFVGRFTDLDYVKSSKYTRQVIWGNAKPSRHITVEKFIINEIRKLIESAGGELLYGLKLTLVSMSNDELVYTVDNVENLYSEDALARFADASGAIIGKVKEVLDIDVKADFFYLRMYDLLSCTIDADTKPKKRGDSFFTKEDLVGGDITLHCVPLPYHAIVYRLMNGFEPQENDMHFVYNGIDCRFNEKFSVYSHEINTEKQ